MTTLSAASVHSASCGIDQWAILLAGSAAMLAPAVRRAKGIDAA